MSASTSVIYSDLFFFILRGRIGENAWKTSNIWLLANHSQGTQLLCDSDKWSFVYVLLQHTCNMHNNVLDVGMTERNCGYFGYENSGFFNWQLRMRPQEMVIFPVTLFCYMLLVMLFWFWFIMIKGLHISLYKPMYQSQRLVLKW